MLCFENGEKLEKFDINRIFQSLTKKSDKSYICCISLYDFERLEIESDFKDKTIEEFNKNAFAKFANDDNYDVLYLDIPSEFESPSNIDASVFYTSKNTLLMIYKFWDDGKNIESTIENVLKKNFSPAKCLLALLDLFTKKDFKALQKLEEEITGVEEELLKSSKKNFAMDISVFRKKLLDFKSYYDQFFDVFEELTQNENEVFTEHELLYCGNLTGRIARLQHTVLNLRDYVTQVREAYQTQVDISLNVTMKIFTVIAAIFLPLMFITSWYGMNMYMPEVVSGSKATYYVVIGLSAAIMIGLIIFFKKKKWF